MTANAFGDSLNLKMLEALFFTVSSDSLFRNVLKRVLRFI